MKVLSAALATRFALLAIFVTGVPAALSQPGARESLDLYVAFTRSGFIGVNEADAKAAFKVFAMRMGEKRGYDITPHVRIFLDTIRALRERHDALAKELARDDGKAGAR